MDLPEIYSRLDKLSDEEKLVLKQIMQEYSQKGTSATLDSLWLADYEEIPVDIETFIKDPQYLGNATNEGKAIYPFWLNVFKDIFNPSSKYFECVLSGAIGIGKTNTAIIGIAYMLYKLLCLKDPQSYYGLTPSSKIVIAFFNVSLDLSYGVAYSRLQNMLLSSPWFRKHGTVRGIKDEIYIPGKHIEFRIGSEEQHGLGQDIFCLVGGTEVLTSNGVVPIESLVNKSLYVYSYNADGNLVISNKCTVVKSGDVTELIEIELENQAVIRCTPDHQWLVNGKWIRASELQVGDDIQSVSNIQLRRGHNIEGLLNEVILKKVLDYQSKTGNTYLARVEPEKIVLAGDHSCIVKLYGDRFKRNKLEIK